MECLLHPFMIVGKNARTGSAVKKMVRAPTERDAEATAKAEGILIDQIDPIHKNGKASAPAGPSALARDDWSRLELAIARGVFRGVLYPLIALVVIVLILSYVAVVAG